MRSFKGQDKVCALVPSRDLRSLQVQCGQLTRSGERLAICYNLGNDTPFIRGLRPSLQQRYINGQNKSEIAREEKCDRETVARIVKFPEMQDFVSQAQQEFFGLMPDTMAALRYALQVDKNPAIGLAVLERTGVTAYRGERIQLPATTAEDGYSRQAIMIANVLLEGREHMRLDLGPEIEKALANDAQESVEAAATPARSARQPKECCISATVAIR